LTSALDRSEWSASLSGRFTSQGKSPRYSLDVQNSREKDHSEDLGTDVRIILKWIGIGK
jgi:hypothetical protein